jgi:uncharacterized Zn-finger protein
MAKMWTPRSYKSTRGWDGLVYPQRIFHSVGTRSILFPLRPPQPHPSSPHTLLDHPFDWNSDSTSWKNLAPLYVLYWYRPHASLIHPIQTAVDCTTCGKTISRKADLPRHMKTHSTNKEGLYVHHPRLFFRDATLTGSNRMQACPHAGCTYRALQRSNLVTHLNVQ